MSVCDLTNKSCKPCEGGVNPLTPAEVVEQLAAVKGWVADQKSTEITKDFSFENFYETMAFVNALAWMAHKENHHPDLKVGYNYCHVRYSTHAIGGLSENDFICAQKVEAIL